MSLGLRNIIFVLEQQKHISDGWYQRNNPRTAYQTLSSAVLRSIELLKDETKKMPTSTHDSPQLERIADALEKLANRAGER